MVLSVVKREMSSAPEAARKHGLPIAKIQRWKEKCFPAGETAPRARPETRRRPNSHPFTPEQNGMIERFFALA